MNRLSIIVCGIALSAVAACAGDSATDSFNDLVSVQERVTVKVCSCAADPAACEEMYLLSDADEDCIRGVVADHDTAEVRAALDCQAAIGEDYFACIDPISCDDMTTALEDCDAAYEAADEACPPVPAELDSATNATCFPR